MKHRARSILLPLPLLLLALLFLPGAEKRSKGIAAKYPGDRGIGKDSRVLLADGFEKDDLAKRWSSVKSHPGTISHATEKADVHSGKRSLRIGSW